MGLLEHLPQLPLEGGQIQPQLRPAAPIDLLQQPEAIGTQLLHQFGGAHLCAADLRSARLSGAARADRR
ncbi:MAG: hypothetical protein RLZZ247_212 [Cyanobacteriota bacterium]